MIVLLAVLTAALMLSGCGSEAFVKEFGDLQVVGSMELKYASQFKVDYLSGGYSLITINEGERFLIVPEGKAMIHNTGDVTVLAQPVGNIYLAATSVMCLFDALNSLDSIAMSGTRADGWYIDNAKAAMENGDIVYAGKYNAPDYELIMSKNCGLAIESTMISHMPEVKDKLEDVGVPVLVERSSYESHPLGRTEWIKLYGLLLGKSELAEDLFNSQAGYLNNTPPEKTGSTVAFFYISSSGNAVVRKSGDYVAKMIELAGADYVFDDSNDDGTATGSMNFNMEQFYATAKEADFIIYNGSIDSSVDTIAELLDKSHLLADFKAVKNNNVWSTNQNLFQETMGFGQMVFDMHRIFTNDYNGSDKFDFLYRLR